MPLSSKQTSEAKKRLQHQLYLARECPDPVFDISCCELTEMPSGVFSLCKVLQKEALLVNNNKLSSLKGGGSVSDLADLRILDLHNNRLTNLSDINFGALRRLQVLNLENNGLRSFPTTITSLGALQTLNIRGNEIRQLPADICQLSSLRTLDISRNKITVLPQQLCEIRTLELLSLDGPKMRYPSASTCSGGTDSIMQFLCAEAGIEYIPPSKVVLSVLSTPERSESNSSFGRRSHSANESSVADTVMQYENLKEQRRRELLRLEKQLEEDQHQQAVLAAKAAASKDHLIQFVAQEQARVDQELVAVRQVKENERTKLLESLTEAERNASELVARLLEMNEKARRTEELLEQMEKERMEQEQWYLVRQEELDIIRRKEVLVSMEWMLEHNKALDGLIAKHLSAQDDVTCKTRSLFSETDDSMENVLNSKHSQKRLLIQQIMSEERLQKEAFEALQCQKDARHKRITSQIVLIEQELAELTLLEVEQKQMRLDTQLNVLTEKRMALTRLLSQLLQERDEREGELRARLAEMEEQKLANQTDYWLAQYQRLLDSKPQSLIDQEKRTEYEVLAILDKAGASDYVSQFSRHHISIETLLQMTDDDLSKIGVHELGLRRAILREIENFVEAKKICKNVEDELSLKQPFRQRIPSAPPFVGADGAATALTPREVTARGLHSECVVCLNAESTILFLDCGHVCVCTKCAEPLQECPLDRSTIVQKIHLIVQQDDSGDLA